MTLDRLEELLETMTPVEIRAKYAIALQENEACEAMLVAFEQLDENLQALKIEEPAPGFQPPKRSKIGLFATVALPLAAVVVLGLLLNTGLLDKQAEAVSTEAEVVKRKVMFEPVMEEVQLEDRVTQPSEASEIDADGSGIQEAETDEKVQPEIGLQTHEPVIVREETLPSKPQVESTPVESQAEPEPKVSRPISPRSRASSSTERKAKKAQPPSQPDHSNKIPQRAEEVSNSSEAVEAEPEATPLGVEPQRVVQRNQELAKDVVQQVNRGQNQEAGLRKKEQPSLPEELTEQSASQFVMDGIEWTDQPRQDFLDLLESRVNQETFRAAFAKEPNVHVIKSREITNLTVEAFYRYWQNLKSSVDWQNLHMVTLDSAERVVLPTNTNQTLELALAFTPEGLCQSLILEIKP